MRLARKTFATTLLAAASAIPMAVVFSTTAAADPVPAPIPGIPGMASLPFLSALSPANAPMLLQGLASTFGGGGATAAPAAAALAPAAPAPMASAAVNLPQAAALPPTLPATAPATLPATLATAPVAPAAAPVSAVQGLVPTAEVTIPQVPMMPLPLPKQLNFPGDLASLMPPGTPLASLLPAAAPAAVAAAAPAVPAATAPVASAVTPGVGTLNPALLFPTAALP